MSFGRRGGAACWPLGSGSVRPRLNVRVCAVGVSVLVEGRGIWPGSDVLKLPPSWVDGEHTAVFTINGLST